MKNCSVARLIEDMKSRGMFAKAAGMAREMFAKMPGLASSFTLEGQMAEELEKAERELQFFEDSPDLPVLGGYELASRVSRAALKAREIWFQRYREVLSPALPPAKRATLFLLKKGKPKSPYRTWIAKMDPGACEAALGLPPSGGPCDVVAHLNFTHHDLPFSLPGSSVLLATTDADCFEPDGWIISWLQRSDRPLLESLLAKTEICLSGPAVRVTEYDADAVDEELLDHSAACAERFLDSSEETYFMYAFRATKVGGGVFYIQGNPDVRDCEGNAMSYIGQVGCTEFFKMGDSGIAYLFYSPFTQETKISVTCF